MQSFKNLANHTPSILVVGDFMLDHYLWGRCDRISPEAPVQVVDIIKETETLGGACNVINNLISLKANVSCCGVVGDDISGEVIINMLKNENVDTSGIFKQQNRKTSKKSRVIASHQQVIRVDMESKEDINDEKKDEILQFITNRINEYDAILLSDYGKGVLRVDLTKEIISLANKNNKLILVDPKGRDYSKYKGAYLLTPNKKEASEATGIEIKDRATLEAAIKYLKEFCSLEIGLITLSEDGIAVLENDLEVIPTVAKEVYDVTGAGDTVLASLGFALSYGLDIVDSCKFANAAAAVVVGKVGSATATHEEIHSYLHSLNKSKSEDKIKTKDEIEHIAKNLSLCNKKIVFTNGCFDILHAGHVKYLEEAKSYGDVLILGLNSDSSIKRLKGEGRPINNEDDRAIVLASLESVDFVTIFDEDTPYNLISLIKPDILVKGGDYEGKDVVGSDIAKEVRLVRFVDGKSTTNIINKVKCGEVD